MCSPFSFPVASPGCAAVILLMSFPFPPQIPSCKQSGFTRTTSNQEVEKDPAQVRPFAVLPIAMWRASGKAGMASGCPGMNLGGRPQRPVCFKHGIDASSSASARRQGFQPSLRRCGGLPGYVVCTVQYVDNRSLLAGLSS